MMKNNKIISKSILSTFSGSQLEAFAGLGLNKLHAMTHSISHTFLPFLNSKTKKNRGHSCHEGPTFFFFLMCTRVNKFMTNGLKQRN